MKKQLYATLILSVTLVTSTFAQRHCDIEVLPLIGPADGSTYSCNGPVVSGYYLVNRGPDILQSTDEIVFFDPNIQNDSLGVANGSPVDPLDPSTWYNYVGIFPTGTVLNGQIGEGENAVEAPHINIPVGDTVLYFQWNDTITRLYSLIKYPDSTVTGVNGNPIDNMYFKPQGTNLPANGTYLWAAYFVGFNTTAVVDTNDANNRKTSKIIINCATSIKDVNYRNIALTVYPNPAKNSINFNYEFLKATNIDARIMDLTGRTLKSINFGKSAPGNHKYEILIDELPSGTYLLELATDDSKGISKFTKN